MPGDARKKCPSSLAADSGGGKVVNGIIAARRDGGKARPIWPKDDHPFARQLRNDPDFVWARMMASVPGGLD